MRRKEQMRYTFCFVKKVRRWHWSRRTWYDLDAACNLALSRCHSLCSILSQQSRGKAPLVLMGRADRLHGYMRRTYFWNFRKTPLFALYPFLLYWIAHIIICLSFVFMYQFIQFISWIVVLNYGLLFYCLLVYCISIYIFLHSCCTIDWLIYLFIHESVASCLSYVFVFSSVSVLSSPTCLFCIVCWFHLFRLYIVYLLIIPFSAELILYRRRFVYLLIYWLCSIHLSFYFCTHFVLFSHLSTHLFIYRLFVRLFFSFHCILFIVHVLFHVRKKRA